jgi:hypothetical protein
MLFTYNTKFNDGAVIGPLLEEFDIDPKRIVVVKQKDKRE